MHTKKCIKLIAMELFKPLPTGGYIHYYRKMLLQKNLETHIAFQNSATFMPVISTEKKNNLVHKYGHHCITVLLLIVIV